MTTPENQTTTQQELEPFFPPIVLFAVACIGFFVAAASRLLTGEFNIIFWAGLIVGIIAFVFWLVMNPRAVVDFVRGRGIAFGGTAIGVSIVLIVAAVLVYMVLDSQNWTFDLTEGKVLTIAENTREVIENLANDPTAGKVRFVAFFTSQNAAGQERLELLLQQFKDLSGDKIEYEFIDPNRQPLIAQQYGENIRDGQVAVVPYDATGNLLYDEAEMLNNPNQYDLTNTMIQVLAAGDFHVVFLMTPTSVDAEDAGPQGADFYLKFFRDTLGWTVDVITPFDLTTDAGLGEMAADGDVLIIPGGTEPLTDAEVNVIAEYVNNGGNLILLGEYTLSADPSLAAADNMGAFLQETYGVRVRNDLVVDEATYFTMESLQLLVPDFVNHFITQPAIAQEALAVFIAPQSIEFAATPPENVTTSVLMTSSAQGYSKQGFDLNSVLEANPEMSYEDFQQLFARAETDVAGPLPVAVISENAAIASRLFVAGSDALMWNTFDGNRGDANVFIMTQAIAWVSHYDEFSAGLTLVQPLEETPPDQVVIDVADVRTIQFIAVYVLPFGALILGVVVWWLRRERVTE